MKRSTNSSTTGEAQQQLQHHHQQQGPHLLLIDTVQHGLEVSNVHVTLLPELINGRLKVAGITREALIGLGESGAGNLQTEALQLLQGEREIFSSNGLA